MTRRAVGSVALDEEVANAVARKLAVTQDLQRKDTEIEIERKERTKREVQAQGIANAMQIIRGQLSAMYIQHEAIEAQKQMVNSPNHTVVYIPVGPMGVPITGTFPTVHDGCVVADDVGGSIKGERIDWFVARKPYYREIDSVLHLAQVSVFDGEREWALVVDAATVVHVDYIETDERIMLSIELGQPPEASRHRIYELLLLYNHGWAETGGVRMALESPGGIIVQFFETGAADLDLIGLRNVVAGFVELARHWRGGITRGIGTAATEGGADLDRLMRSGAIRG